MNFGKIFDRKKSDSPSKNTEEILRIKARIEKEDRAFEEELPAKHSLLQEFSEEDLKRLCSEVLGAGPPADEFTDQESGTVRKLPQFKEDYIHFIIEELRLSDIADFAARNKIARGRHFKN